MKAIFVDLALAADVGGAGRRERRRRVGHRVAPSTSPTRAGRDAGERRQQPEAGPEQRTSSSHPLEIEEHRVRQADPRARSGSAVSAPFSRLPPSTLVEAPRDVPAVQRRAERAEIDQEERAGSRVAPDPRMLARHVLRGRRRGCRPDTRRRRGRSSSSRATTSYRCVPGVVAVGRAVRRRGARRRRDATVCSRVAVVRRRARS